MPHDPVRCAVGGLGHITQVAVLPDCARTQSAIPMPIVNTIPVFVSGGDRGFQIVAAAAPSQTRFPPARKLITLRCPSKRTRPDLRLATRYPPVPKSIEGHTRSLTVQRKTGDYTRLGLCPVQQRCSRR